MDEVEQVWREWWEPIVAPNGVLDVEQVKRELFDFHALLENVPLVYDHITNGKISKPNTLASVVIAEYDDALTQHVEECVKDELEYRQRLQNGLD